MPNKKIQFLNNSKLNIDAGVIINNGYANSGNAYPSPKPKNVHQNKIGFNIGMLMSQGKSSYFKNILFFNLTETQAELEKTTSYFTEDLGNKRRHHYNRNEYLSSLYTLSVGAGIRFVLFKHINLDNGFTYNIPFYSKNYIKEKELIYEEYNNYTYYYLNSKTTIDKGEKTSNEIFLKNYFAFRAKISYEFNIKGNRYGLFGAWNYGWANNAQWHMFGVAYYPFKKLR